MEYNLRINHHARDHGGLICGGIRPALARMHAVYGPVPAALRAHWRDGPHLLIGLELEPERSADGAWAILETEVRKWLSSAPFAPPLDPAAYDALSRSLAEREGLPPRPLALRPDNSVERGAWAVPAPLGIAGLAPLRDAFSAGALEDILALVEVRLADPDRALLGWLKRIVCLHHLNWRDDLRLWPLSPQGQALVVTQSSDNAARDFPALTARLGPALVEVIEREGLLGGELRMSEDSRRWLDVAQQSYNRLLDFVDAAAPSFFDNIRREFLESDPRPSRESYGMAPDRAARILSHPTHFAFRMLINFAYAMLPPIGFSASHRLFACYLLTRTLETHYPEVMRRATDDGLKL